MRGGRGRCRILLKDIAMTQHDHDEVITVEHVDLQRYLGSWYEIARKPMWAEDRDARGGGNKWRNRT